ncbi:hypothetical protein KI387_019465, partial [Taxus chinensis]
SGTSGQLVCEPARSDEMSQGSPEQLGRRYAKYAKPAEPGESGKFVPNGPKANGTSGPR